MSLPTAPTPTGVAPLTPSTAFDPGIPLNVVEVGSGGRSLSRAATQNGDAQRVAFAARIDAHLAPIKMGKATSHDIRRHRDALALALRSQVSMDVPKVASCLEALYTENMLHSVTTHVDPKVFHLNMGFDLAGPMYLRPATNLIGRLLENAESVMSLLKNERQKTVLRSICEQWSTYDMAFQKMQGAARSTRTLRHTSSSSMVTDGERSKNQRAEILSQVTQRDDLLASLHKGNAKAAQAVLSKLSPTAALQDQFPEGKPGNFTAKVWNHAHRAPFEDHHQLQTYVTRGLRLAGWELWVLEKAEPLTAADGACTPALRHFCDVMRITGEISLADHAVHTHLQVALRKVLATQGLAAALAQQPFTSLRQMFHKSVLLEPYLNALEITQFRSAVERAQSIQEAAPIALRDLLLKSELDRSKLRPLVLITFARLATALKDDLGAGTTSAQRLQLQRMLSALDQMETLDHLDDGESVYSAVLKRLIRTLDAPAFDGESESLAFARVETVRPEDL